MWLNLDGQDFMKAANVDYSWADDHNENKREKIKF